MKQLRNYQQIAVDVGVKRNLLLCDECGLGKTVTAISIAANFTSRSQWRVLVICPKRVRDQWVDEITESGLLPKPPVILESGLPLEFQTEIPPHGWFILHYEVVGRLLTSLNRYLWDMVIIDEAHRMSNRKNRWTRAIKSIHAIRKIALTGTPMEKSPQDMWSLFNWLYPEKYTSYWKFFERNFEWEWNFGGSKKFVAILNPDGFAKEISHFVMRRTKKEVAPELPPLIERRVKVRMTTEQETLYRRVDTADDIVVNVGDEQIVVAGVLAKITKLQQITSWPGQVFSPVHSSGKVEWVIEWIKDNPDQTVMVFAKYRQTIEHLAHHLDEPCDIIMGGIRSSGEMIKKGQARVLLGTIAAMGEGLDLPMVDNAVFIDQEWSTIKMTQAVDRIHRINITVPKNVYMLHTPGTIDTLVLRALDNKWTNKELVYAALEHWRRVV